jgi:hypothetical protein
MAMLAESVDAVIGVDTHTDTHTACLVDDAGREVGIVTVEASPDGYGELLAWAVQQAPGRRVIWAVEGCRSHGAGLLRALLAAGQQVVEAGRPQRVGRRPGGKSDPADALLAARTALAADHHAHPSRSRGTSTGTGPTSVSTVLPRAPLREFPPFLPAGSPLSVSPWIAGRSHDGSFPP